MKYVRRVTALVLILIFCVAIVIGIGVIYSVRNVNVEFIGYSEEYNAEYEQTKQNLNKLKGTGIWFLSDGDVQSKVVEGGVIVLESYEKIYPCTINVTLKERVECFVVREGDFYCVYDEEGVLLRSERAGEGEYLNALDSSPNVLVKAGDGTLTNEDYPYVALLCTSVKDDFGALRRLVDGITVYDSLNTAKISFRSGISVNVFDWKNGAEEKIQAVYEVYENLSDKQRTGGSITVGSTEQGAQPTAKYTPA